MMMIVMIVIVYNDDADIKTTMIMTIIVEVRWDLPTSQIDFGNCTTATLTFSGGFHLSFQQVSKSEMN
jgi:hypothetical protein